MPLYDTLQPTGGDEKSLADWGFSLGSCVGERGSQKPDTFKGTIVTAQIADDPIFPFEQEVTVRAGRTSVTGAANSFSGGVVKFIGKRTLNGLKASSSGQGVSYTFENGRYDLDNTQYKQTYQDQVGAAYPGETILFSQSPPGGAFKFITAGQQISDVLTYAIGTGLKAQVGAIDPNIYLPSLITKPLECTAALDKCLEMFPRTSEIWDYTTLLAGVPTPTVSFRTVDNLPSVTLPLFDGTNHKSIAIKRRDDLVARAVVITYRITNTVDGTSGYEYPVDQWGPVMEAAYQAAGGDSNVVAANLAAQAVSAQAVYLAAFNAYQAAHPGDPEIEADADAAGNAAVKAAVLAGTCDPRDGIRVPSDMIELAGITATNVRATLDVEPLACIGGTAVSGAFAYTAARRAWWSSGRGGELKKFLDSRVRFPLGDAGLPPAKIFYASSGLDSTGAAVSANQEFTAADYAFYTNRIVSGTYHAWMKMGSTPVKAVKAVKVKVSVQAQFTAYGDVATSDTLGTLPANEAASDACGDVLAGGAGNVTEKPLSHEEHCNITLTNGISELYSTTSSLTLGELYIIGVAPALYSGDVAGAYNGIARSLWLSLKTLQYEGDYIKVESNFTNGVSMANRLNLSGGRTEWLTMNAQIIGITEDYDTHTTSVSIGPAKHLNQGQLKDLLNMWRVRQPWKNPAVRNDNTLQSGGNVDMPLSAGGSNTEDGVENIGRIQGADYVIDPMTGLPTAVVAGMINSDPAKVTTVLAAAPTATPVTPSAGADPNIGIKTMKPQKINVACSDGSVAKAIVHMTDVFTES